VRKLRRPFQQLTVLFLVTAQVQRDRYPGQPPRQLSPDPSRRFPTLFPRLFRSWMAILWREIRTAYTKLMHLRFRPGRPPKISVRTASTRWKASKVLAIPVPVE
jgi:hypothetical protein